MSELANCREKYLGMLANASNVQVTRYPVSTLPVETAYRNIWIVGSTKKTISQSRPGASSR